MSVPSLIWSVFEDFNLTLNMDRLLVSYSVMSIGVRCRAGSKAVLSVVVSSPDLMKAKNPCKLHISSAARIGPHAVLANNQSFVG